MACWDIWEKGRAEAELWQKPEGVQGSTGLLAQRLLLVMVLPVGALWMCTAWNHMFRNEDVFIWDVLITLNIEFSGR